MAGFRCWKREKEIVRLNWTTFLERDLLNVATIYYLLYFFLMRFGYPRDLAAKAGEARGDLTPRRAAEEIP